MIIVTVDADLGRSALGQCELAAGLAVEAVEEPPALRGVGDVAEGDALFAGRLEPVG
ncbi:hypothetical protein ACIRJO_27155 [Streptomyces sp. NPDC102394]|uniref:hypothetical protein n=1 Tax=Streptomyces sp. NPDC102394 TaxID=3366167 RepID=UPI0038169F6E